MCFCVTVTLGKFYGPISRLRPISHWNFQILLVPFCGPPFPQQTVAWEGVKKKRRGWRWKSRMWELVSHHRLSLAVETMFTWDIQTLDTHYTTVAQFHYFFFSTHYLRLSLTWHKGFYTEMLVHRSHQNNRTIMHHSSW